MDETLRIILASGATGLAYAFGLHKYTTHPDEPAWSFPLEVVSIVAFFIGLAYTASLLT